MNDLKIWDDHYGLFEQLGEPVVSSRYVAEIFEKNHQHVLESIRKLLDPQNGLSEGFILSNFRQYAYKNKKNINQPEYLLTRDGFTILVMGFTGSKAMKFKEAYINRFNDMERYLIALNTAKMEFPELTAAILEVHEKPMFYHFSNEMDMINRIVLGMTAKEFKKQHGIDIKEKSIRPYLSTEQIEYISFLQKADIGLVLNEPDFQKRKRTLEWYYSRIIQKKLVA